MNPSNEQIRQSWRNRHRLRKGIRDPLAWGTIVLVFFMVIGWRLLVLASRPAHMMQIAVEAGAFGQFLGTPFATADGNSVSFFRGTERGEGLFICDSASGKQRLVYEDPGNLRNEQFGWSPDGKLLAFSGIKDGKDALLILNAESGRIETSIALYGPLKEFVWLSPSSFVFLKGSSTLDSLRGGLMRVDRQPNSSWSAPYNFAKELAATEKKANANAFVPIKGLMATSPDSLAWYARNALWEWKFQDSIPVRLWRGSSTNRILECEYSPETGVFLLLLGNTNHVSVASYSPGAKRPITLGETDDINVTNVVWVNHGKGYAYLLNESGSHSIVVKADCASDRPTQSISQDGVRVFTSSGGSIYAIGCLAGQPKGVVQYDCLSEAAKYLAATQTPFHFIKNVIPIEGVLTNSLGEKHAYRVWEPTHFDPRKKYPVVFAQGIHLWNEYAEAVANAGGYYISVERPEFNHPQIQHLPEDVMAAYQLMATNSNVDTNNVYICGASEETGLIVELLNDGPALWKGAILTSPVDFPKLSSLRNTRLLINCGDADEYQTFGRVKNFQQNAAREGICVTVAAHHTGHVFVSSLANKESTQEFVKFVFN